MSVRSVAYVFVALTALTSCSVDEATVFQCEHSQSRTSDKRRFVADA